jgi:hypothetical protein
MSLLCINVYYFDEQSVWSGIETSLVKKNVDKKDNYICNFPYHKRASDAYINEGTFADPPSWAEISPNKPKEI